MPENARLTFALLVTAAPFNSAGADTALRFAKAVLAEGHRIERVFFFREGVHAASNLSVVPQDERNLPQAWQAFCHDASIDAVVCVSAALKRGIADRREKERHRLAADNLGTPMIMAGLGQLADALISADRVVTFG